jgi:hypothetical protein
MACFCALSLLVAFCGWYMCFLLICHRDPFQDKAISNLDLWNSLVRIGMITGSWRIVLFRLFALLVLLGCIFLLAWDMDMESVSSLLSHKEKNPTIFVVGFPKCGTSSIDAFLHQMNFKTAHWKINRDKPSGGDLVANLMMKAHREGKKLLTYVKDWKTQYSFKIITEMNGEGQWPQVTHMNTLYEQYPDALYILNVRDYHAHFMSLVNQKRYDLIFMQQLAPLYNITVHRVFNDAPEAKFDNVTDAENEQVVTLVLKKHYDFIRNFFKSRPNAHFIEFNIEHDSSKKFDYYLPVGDIEFPREYVTADRGHKKKPPSVLSSAWRKFFE